jgi:hypothetical protein
LVFFFLYIFFFFFFFLSFFAGWGARGRPGRPPPTPARDHVSGSYLLACPLNGAAVVLAGTKARIAEWRHANPSVTVEATIPFVADVAVRHDIESAARSKAAIVVLADGPKTPAEIEAALLASLPSDKILLYPAELGEIDNPTGGDRAQHGVLR